MCTQIVHQWVLILNIISLISSVIFPHSWWQNTQKLQVNFSPTESQFNEVSWCMHWETNSALKSCRTTGGILFSSLLFSFQFWCWIFCNDMYIFFEAPLTNIVNEIWNHLVIICLISSVFFQVCLGWPVASFPGGKAGLQKCAQNNLRVKSGDKVMLHPITGPVLQAEEVVLSNR